MGQVTDPSTDSSKEVSQLRDSKSGDGRPWEDWVKEARIAAEAADAEFKRRMRICRENGISVRELADALAFSVQTTFRQSGGALNNDQEAA